MPVFTRHVSQRNVVAAKLYVKVFCKAATRLGKNQDADFQPIYFEVFYNYTNDFEILETIVYIN